MELDQFVIENSLAELCSSPCRESEQNASPAAPPAPVPDSPFHAFADVLDFEVSANLILPNTCFKPITSDGQAFHNLEEGDEVLFLDLEDWAPCEEDPHISSLYEQELDPMAALLAFNASCTSPCNRCPQAGFASHVFAECGRTPVPAGPRLRSPSSGGSRLSRSFDFKTPPDSKFPVSDGTDPASSCSSSYSSFRSSFGSSAQTSPNAVPSLTVPTSGQSSQFACPLSQQQQQQRYHPCPPAAVSPPSPSYHHLSPGSYPPSPAPAYFCNPSPQTTALSQPSHNQVHASQQNSGPNGSEGYTGPSGGGHYSTASVSVNLSMNMTMGFAPSDTQPPIQWSMSPSAYANNSYSGTGYQMQSYPQQSHGQGMVSHQTMGSNESGMHAAYTSVPPPAPLHEFRAASCSETANSLPSVEKDYSTLCSFRPSLSPSPVSTSFPTPVLTGCSPYQLRETGARFHSANACLRSQRKCFSRSTPSFPELPAVSGDLLDSPFYTTTRSTAPDCDQDQRLGDNDPSRQQQEHEERRGSPSEGPPTCNLCRICGKTYARPSTLKTHLRTHSGERPYRCDHCHKSFSQAANLTAHIRTHSGEKPFRCLICERRFSQSSSVTTHMRTHSGERPYRCRMCKKAFSDSSTLTKHLRIHSGEKPYVCRLCNLRFSQSGNLNRHMRIHSPLM